MSRKVTRGERSEEERLLQLQHRVQAEEEVARRKEETVTMFLQDKLQKEQRNSAVNLLKLNEGWRKILRQARDAELRQDLTVLQQTFERQLDELNFIIKKLVCDLQEAELQAAQVQQSHLQQVEFLWTQQDKRLQSVQQQWDIVLQDISSTSSSEKDQMMCGLQQQRTKLQEEQLCAERHSEETTAEDQMSYSETLELLLSNQEDLLVMKRDNMKLKDMMSKNLQDLQTSRDTTKTLDEQISRNKKQISSDLRKITWLKDRVTRLKQQIISTKAEKVLMDQDLSSATNTTNQKCLQLRDQLAREREAARKKLVELSDRSGAVTRRLQEVINKGEKVLHVAEMCHKLQSKQEDLMKEHGQVRSGPDRHQNQDQMFGEFEELQHLLNVALLHREHLRNHQLDLSRENQQLELLLQQHGDGLDGHHCPLLVSQAPSTSVPVAADRRHNIIEATHVVKNCL